MQNNVSPTIFLAILMGSALMFPSNAFALLVMRAKIVASALKTIILQFPARRLCHGGMLAGWDLAAHARGRRRKQDYVASVGIAMMMQQRAPATTAH